MSNIAQWSTTASGNSAPAPDGFPEDMPASGVNDAAREAMAAIARDYEDRQGNLVTAGTATAYTLTTNNLHAALADIGMLAFRAHVANTGSAPTLAVDSLAAKTIVKSDGSAIGAGDIALNGVYLLTYNETNDVFHIVLGGGSSSVITTRGDIIYGNSSGEAARLAIGAADTYLKSDGTDVSWAAVSGGGGGGSAVPNVLFNGGFMIAQRGTSFDSTTNIANNDDTYLLDRWLLLSDGNDAVDVSQETTTVPVGSFSACKLDVETASKKAGLLQIIEANNAEAIIGGSCSLSFKARAGGSNATVDKLRAAVLSWDGTADTVTSDVVSAWNGEGADPTLVANWTYENTPSDLTLTSSYQTFSIENISIDTASTTNVAVFIWIDNSDGTVGDLVYITDVNLVSGESAQTYYPRPFAQDLALCQRYFSKNFPYDDAPASEVADSFDLGYAQSASEIRYFLFWPQEMVAAPSVTLYAPVSGTPTGSQWVYTRSGTAYNGAATVVSTNASGAQFNIAASSLGVDNASKLNGMWIADAEL